MPYFETGSTQLIARSGYSSADGFTDVIKKIGSAIKSGAGSALNFYGQQQQQAGQIQAYQQQAAARPAGGMPGWVLPAVAVAGVGILALLLLKRKRRNPSRGKGRARMTGWDRSIAKIMHPGSRPKRGRRRRHGRRSRLAAQGAAAKYMALKRRRRSR